MHFGQLATTTLALALPAFAQTPTVTEGPSQSANPSQVAAFRSVVSTYSVSFKAAPQYSNLILNLALNLPADGQSSLTADTRTLLPVPTGSAFNLYSFATNPPTSFPQLGWESFLTGNPELSSSVDSLRTSAILALATSAQSVLGTSASINTPPPPTASSSAAAAPAMAAPTLPPFSGGALGAAAGLVGMAAILL